MRNLAVENEITTVMGKHNFVTIADLSKEKILYLIKSTQEFEKHPSLTQK